MIQVLDGANPEIMEQYLAVREVLKELDLLDAEIITVLNKADLIETRSEVLDRICEEWDAIPISALTSAGIDDLLNELGTG